MAIGPAVRAMPLSVEDRVWRANEAAYREASKSYSALKESVMTAPLSSPIQASVLNLGACRDEQFAMDGEQNGAFTGALLEVWENGRFTGSYHAFRDAIDARINSSSQTPQLFDNLQREPIFTADRPFTILSTVKPKPASALQPASVATAAPAVDEDEGEETDTLSDLEVKSIFEAKSRCRLPQFHSCARLVRIR